MLNTNNNNYDRRTEEISSGNERGDRTNEAISIILRADEGASSSTLSVGKRAESQDERNERLEKIVEQWAKENGLWIEDIETIANPNRQLGEGSEKIAIVTVVLCKCRKGQCHRKKTPEAI